MTNRELIAHLQTLNPDLPVAYALHSEYTLMAVEDVEVRKLQPARPDGWIHDSFGKQELCTVSYVVFPGN